MSADSLTRSRVSGYADLRAPQPEIDPHPQPQTDPRFWLRVAIAAGAAFSVGSAWAMILVRVGGWTHGLPRELELLARLHQPLPTFADWVVVQVPWLGTNLVFVPVLAPTCWYLWKKRHRPDLATLIAVTTAGNYVIGMALKFVFERPRPSLWMPRGEYTGSAYPSGHVMAVTGVVGIAAVLLYEERHTIWPLVAWMLLLIATAYSRLYLGVHWPTDVAGGLLIGGTWFVGILWAKRTDVATHPATTFSFPERRVERVRAGGRS